MSILRIIDARDADHECDIFDGGKRVGYTSEGVLMMFDAEGYAETVGTVESRADALIQANAWLTRNPPINAINWQALKNLASGE